jgi:uncharacterized membrane protein
MATALRRAREASETASNVLKAFPVKHVDHVLAWYGVANALRSALKGRVRKKTARLPPSGGSREVVAVVAGVTALAVGAYAVRRHYLGKQALDQAEHGQLRAVTSMAIQATPRSLYDLLTNPQRLSEVVDAVELLDASQKGVTRWRLTQGPGGEYDVHIVDDAPGSLIAWRIIGASGDPYRAVISLDPTDGGHGTRVRVQVEPDESADGLDSAARAADLQAKLGAMAPAMAAQLRRLKQSVETGEIATTRGQPVGRRSIIGKLLTRGES